MNNTIKNLPATVMIYTTTCTKGYMMAEQGEGVSLEPWGCNTAYYEGHDDGGVEYLLPEGLFVGKTKIGDTAIFHKDHDGCCEIFSERGKIFVLSPDAKHGWNHPVSIPLSRADNE